jgi:hypothetical protein
VSGNFDARLLRIAAVESMSVLCAYARTSSEPPA